MMMNPFFFNPPPFLFYPCPTDKPLIATLPPELQTLFKNIPTMMMYDRGNQLTAYYRNLYQRSSHHEEAPSLSGKHLHLLVFHDPEVYQNEKQYKIITPEKASDLIQRFNTNGKIIKDTQRNAYIQIEKMEIGNTTVNITFLFCRLHHYFSLSFDNTHLLDINGNRFLFREALAFNYLFNPPVQIDHIKEASLTAQPKAPQIENAEQPENIKKEETERTHHDTWEPIDESILNDGPWSEALKGISSQATTKTKESLVEESFYSVLEVEDGADVDASSRANQSAKTSNIFAKRKTSHQKRQAQQQPPQDENRSIITELQNLASASTQYLWTIASKSIARHNNQAERVQQSAKRLEAMNNYLQRQPKPPTVKVASADPKDPLEKLLKHHTPSLTLIDLAHDLNCEPFKNRLLDSIQSLQKFARSKQFIERKALLVDKTELYSYYFFLMVSLTTLLGILYAAFINPAKNNTDHLNTIGTLVCCVILTCLKRIRNPSMMVNQSELLKDTFEESLKLIIDNAQNEEVLFFAITRSLILLKEMQARKIATYINRNSHLADCMMNITELISELPTSSKAGQFYGIFSWDEFNRRNLIISTMCCLLLIHRTKLSSMILSNCVPEVTVAFMSTEEQIGLMKNQLDGLKTLITGDMLASGKKLKPAETDEIFYALDTIMLIYVLRNDPNHDPFFESFRQDYAELVKYADDKIATYIKTQNEQLVWPHNCTTIHQTPVKSTLFSAAWMEDRPMAVRVLQKITGIEQDASANRQKNKVQ